MISGGFWSMGGYARFVWPCFAFVGLILAWNLWAARAFLADAQMRASRALAMAASDRS